MLSGCFELSNDEREPSNLASAEQNVGLVLSGGGAKGAFQMGALEYLYTEEFPDKDIVPSIICGTSVGSINSAKLAEGGSLQAQQTAFQELKEVWLNLIREEDMYLKEPWVQKVLKKFAELNESAGRLKEGGWLNNLFDIIINSDCEKALKALDSIRKQFFDEHSDALFNLDPMEERLNDPEIFNPADVRSSGVDLRVSIVGLESGDLRFVREDGVMTDRYDRPVMESRVDLSDAVLASGSMPVIFKPVEMASPLGLSTETYIDGGVREYLPLDMALNHLDADRCYAIMAGAPAESEPVTSEYGYRPESDSGPLPISSPPTASILSRTIDLFIDEIAVGGSVQAPPVASCPPLSEVIEEESPELNPKAGLPSTEGDDNEDDGPLGGIEGDPTPKPGAGLPGTAEPPSTEAADEPPPAHPCETETVTLIRPSFDVIGVKEVDPGLISIAMAYGYMRAADIVLDKPCSVHRQTGAIIKLRREIWEYENALHRLRQQNRSEDDGNADGDVPVPPLPEGPDSEEAVAAKIEDMKAELDQLVQTRMSNGPVPPDATEWANGPERHTWQYS